MILTSIEVVQEDDKSLVGIGNRGKRCPDRFNDKFNELLA